MAKTVFREKTALVLGADAPVGRSVALQLSRLGCRVVLAGFDGPAIREVAEFLTAKSGKPLECLLDAENPNLLPSLLEARGTVKHFHFAVNAIAASPNSFPGSFAGMPPLEVALKAEQGLMELQQGKGAMRLLTIVPQRADLTSPRGEPSWYSLVRLGSELASPGAEESDGIKPAAIADSVVWLLSCPPGGCPVEVTLQPRELKV